MFDEEGRKIDLDTPRPRRLETLGIDDMNEYIQWLHNEIVRTQAEIDRRGNTRSAAEAFFS